MLFLFLHINASLAIDLTCNYVLSNDGEYECQVAQFVYDEQTEITNFVGAHVEGKNDDDVVTVSFNSRSNFYQVPQQILGKFKNTKTLNVPNALLKTIQPLENCNELEKFTAIGSGFLTGIQRNAFEKCGKLKSVTIENTRQFKLTEEIGAPGLTELKIVNANIDQLNKMSFDGMVNLETLDLSKNPIRTIESKAFQDLRKLNSVYMTNLNLQSIPKDLLETIGDLKFLVLNQITTATYKLSEEFLQHLKRFNLENLDLSGMLDGNISADFFDNMTNMKVLTLTSCSIKTIQASWFRKMENLLYLYLGEGGFFNFDFMVFLTNFLSFSRE